MCMYRMYITIYVFQFTQEKKEDYMMIVKLWILRYPELIAHWKVRHLTCT